MSAKEGFSERPENENNNQDHNAGDNERPLKKARYVWQVKGKYHLKDTMNNSAINSNSLESTSTAAELQDNTKNINGSSSGQANSNNCKGTCCIDALLSHSESIMDNEESSDEDPPKNVVSMVSEDVPVSLVKTSPKNEDYYLMKWQARQVAKGYLDNTINKVLESWMVSPFDATDFVENCDNDGKVEDEGILMAIQSHGLQSGTPSWNEAGTQQSDLASLVRPQDIIESTMDNHQNVHNELLKSKLKEDEASANCLDENSCYDEHIEMNDQHMSFLDAAVSAAIQKKGLTSHDYALLS